MNPPVTVVPVSTEPRTLSSRDAGTRPVPESGPSAVPSGDVGFDKYTLCGNTFLIVDETRTPLRDNVERSRFARWALDEHFGVGGANNVIYLTRLSDPRDATHAFRIFEQDGSESLSCGNGLLCAAAVFGRGDPAAGLGGPAGGWRVLTELPTGRPQPVRVGIRADGGGTWVDVGPPRRMPTDLFSRPAVADNDTLDGAHLDVVDTVDDIEVDLPVGGADEGVELVTVGLSGWLVFTGEPHLVLVLGHGLPLKLRARFFPHRDRTSGGPLARAVLDSNELMDRLGVAVNTRHAAWFPRGVHVNVVDVLDSGGLLRYRTWERAIDQETLACGSGALACAHVCRVRGLTTARRSTLLPYRCRCHRADAFLRVTDNPGSLVLEGNPMLVCSGVVPSGARTDQADYPTDKDPATVTKTPALHADVERRTDQSTSAVRDPEARMRAVGIEVVPIPRAVDSTPEGLRRLVSEQRRPAVFSGLADGWRARQAWSPDGLRSRHGDRQVTALVDLPGEGVLLPQDQARYERDMSLAEFVDVMLSTSPESPCYLAYKRAEELFDPRDYDFDVLLADDGHGRDTRVWMGSAGTRSMLHSDLKDNLFCQIWGKKSVTLLSWRDSRAAYPFSDNLVNSQVDLAWPDLRRFPRLRSARFYHATIEPGEILFIPRGWWHDIRSCTPSVSINHWFGEPQRLGEYLRLLVVSGPRYWLPTMRDFIMHGLLRRSEETRFFFSPPSTGKRLYDALRWRNFSRENDPNLDG